jgi:hypothetical protein
MTWDELSAIGSIGAAVVLLVASIAAVIQSHDFADPETLRKAFADGLDHRMLMYGGFYQTVARLINHKILDRDLFAPLFMTAPRVWRAVRPIAYEMRARDPANPRWMDLEYLVYTCNKNPVNLKRYTAEFRDRVGLDRHLMDWSQQAREASMPMEAARSVLSGEEA